MTQLYRRYSQIAIVALVAVVAVTGASASAGHQDYRPTVVAETTTFTASETTASVGFVIQVDNQNGPALKDLTVIFNKDYSVVIGEVAATGKATSTPQNISLDMSSVGTKTVAVPVTVTFTMGETPVRTEATLVFGRIE